MYYQGGKLKYDEVTLTNKSSIPMELTYSEAEWPLPKTIAINPGTTITVKLGQGKGYQSNGSKITYRPIPDNPSFKQEFPIDLPSSRSYVFTAVKLAEIMNNIWVPGVFYSDDKGEYPVFQYMNMGHPAEWQKVVQESTKTKILKP